MFGQTYEYVHIFSLQCTGVQKRNNVDKDLSLYVYIRNFNAFLACGRGGGIVMYCRYGRDTVRNGGGEGEGKWGTNER